MLRMGTYSMGTGGAWERWLLAATSAPAPSADGLASTSWTRRTPDRRAGQQASRPAKQWAFRTLPAWCRKPVGITLLQEEAQLTSTPLAASASIGRRPAAAPITCATASPLATQF